jgi:DNA-binding CsgD family transcriptional regulator/PAS domain-containing protein
MEKGIGELLLAVYDAAFSSDRWPNALDAYTEALDARGVLLVCADTAGLPFRVQEQCGAYPPGAVREYLRRFGHHDQAAWEHHVRKNEPWKLCPESDAWPSEQDYRQRENIRFLREVYNIQSRACILISQDKGAVNVLTLQFSKPWNEVPPISPVVDQSMPHLTKVLEIYRTMELLRQRYNAALAALDHLGVGLCVSDQQGRMALVNSEAKRIFGLADGLMLSREGALLARDEDVTRAIRNAIQLAVHTAAGEKAQEEVVLHCRRPSRADAFLIEICPLRDAGGELERGFFGSLICIIDPAQTRQIKVDGLAKVFSLSPRETDVCRQLIAGASNSDIADARNVSVETVRAQVKSAYAKLGVANRIELIRKAVAIHPPIL